MFKAVLIANRGEIACRIIKTLQKLHIKAVAVFSEADRHAMHVAMADSAYFIGEAHPLKSYLNQEAVLVAAKQAGVDAIHPGYGFLSENATFAQAVIDAGLTWIGPNPTMIEMMGHKAAARQAMQNLGLPIIPGRNLTTASNLTQEVAALGLPIMIKAALGGGGIGMKRVTSLSELEAAFNEAQTRAQRSFGNAELYLEKYLTDPSHIEIQILADRHHHVIHLLERDCSLQRRHQKVVEESPSPKLSPLLRQTITEQATAAMNKMGYDSVGTIEGLLDGEKNYYFLEMNTRLQVEHPVTEAITGLDLVELQLRSAMGERLELQQSDIKAQGHAIELRLYAESSKNFFPSPGTITTLEWPSGEGVRIDTGIRAGDTITPFYDPMIAKLIVHATTRPQAIVLAQQALAKTTIEGIKTNIAFLEEALAHPDFQAGTYTTHLVHDLRPGL